MNFYRVECFRDIGGFVREVAWDGIYGYICRLSSWIAQSVDDPAMRIIILRPVGNSQENFHADQVHGGAGKYCMGPSWYSLAASTINRSLELTYLRGGLGICKGYFAAMLHGHQRYQYSEYLRHMRRFEHAQLVLGKDRALVGEYSRVHRVGAPRRRRIALRPHSPFRLEDQVPTRPFNSVNSSGRNWQRRSRRSGRTFD